jgi:hypothetical protein
LKDIADMLEVEWDEKTRCETSVKKIRETITIAISDY